MRTLIMVVYISTLVGCGSAALSMYTTSNQQHVAVSATDVAYKYMK